MSQIDQINNLFYFSNMQKTKLDDYEMTGPMLGKGSFGEVWTVKNKITNVIFYNFNTYLCRNSRL